MPSTANGISVMLGVNNVSQTSNMQNMLNSLHTRYPSAQIYVNSVYHVGTKYRGSVTNAMIDSFNQTMSSWCSSNSWATYVDVTNGLNESNGYIKSSYTNDGLHLNSSGQAILVNNIKNAIGGSVNDTYGSWVKIKHNIVIGNNEYNFYSVYNNLGSVTLRQGDNISKGTKIGVIGASSNPGLHFEFHNEQDSAIDPTNLFIQCSSGGVLVGNTNEEQIWNYLLGLGYSKAGVSGVMGNWMQESGFLPNNLENGANSKSGLSDEEFTSEVDNGNISKSEFITSSRFSIYSGGRYGYGLAQWTDPGRKTNFYEFWKSQNTSSIADLKMQLDFYKKEADGYDGLNDSLKNATSPEEAASIFVNIYEVGTAGEARRQNARNIYNKYANQ